MFTLVCPEQGSAPLYFFWQKLLFQIFSSTTKVVLLLLTTVHCSLFQAWSYFIMNNGLGLRRWKYLVSNGYANLLGKEWGAISSTSMSNIHCHLERAIKK